MHQRYELTLTCSAWVLVFSLGIGVYLNPKETYMFRVPCYAVLTYVRKPVGYSGLEKGFVTEYRVFNNLNRFGVESTKIERRL